MDREKSNENAKRLERRRPGITERLRHDRGTSLLWAALLIWGAIALFMDMTYLVDNSWWDTGAIFLVGAGIIILADGIYRLFKAEHHRRILLRFIIGVLALGGGISTLVSVRENIVLIIILLLVAGAILINTIGREKTEEEE